MSEPPSHKAQVRVVQRIEVCDRSAVVTVDPGVFDAGFLCDMLGHTRYMQAYADGHLVMMHEG